MSGGLEPAFGQRPFAPFRVPTHSLRILEERLRRPGTWWDRLLLGGLLLMAAWAVMVVLAVTAHAGQEAPLPPGDPHRAASAGAVSVVADVSVLPHVDLAPTDTAGVGDASGAGATQTPLTPLPPAVHGSTPAATAVPATAVPATAVPATAVPITGAPASQPATAPTTGTPGTDKPATAPTTGTPGTDKPATGRTSGKPSTEESSSDEPAGTVPTATAEPVGSTGTGPTASSSAPGTGAEPNQQLQTVSADTRGGPAGDSPTQDSADPPCLVPTERMTRAGATDTRPASSPTRGGDTGKSHAATGASGAPAGADSALASTAVVAPVEQAPLRPTPPLPVAPSAPPAVPGPVAPSGSAAGGSSTVVSGGGGGHGNDSSAELAILRAESASPLVSTRGQIAPAAERGTGTADDSSARPD